MIVLLIAMIGGFAAFPEDTSASDPEVRPKVRMFASAYGTVAEYSTETHLRAVSGYLTLEHASMDFYTLGYERLWLDADSTGGGYFTQDLFTARASWWLGSGFGAAVHYAYLYEHEVAGFAPSEGFHLGGGGANYWISPELSAGGSVTLTYSRSSLAASTLRAGVVYHIGDGVWMNTGAILTDSRWTAGFVSVRHLVSLPLGGGSYLTATADIGRRIFFFDDELLLLHNQRGVENGGVALKASLRVFDRYYLIPAVEHAVSDQFSVTYGTIGLKMVW